MDIFGSKMKFNNSRISKYPTYLNYCKSNICNIHICVLYADVLFENTTKVANPEKEHSNTEKQN